MHIFSQICAAMMMCVEPLHASMQEKEEKSSSRFPISVDAAVAFDDFRGIYSGSWQNSFGALAALSFLIDFPCSFSGALGGSYGLYDWAGRASTPYKNAKTYQQQGFLTAAFFWQTPQTLGCSAGIAYDWMLNKNFGLFALNPFLDQIRAQFGYSIRKKDEIGIWASYAIHTSDMQSQGIPIQFKGISQANLFWNHVFSTQGNFMLWLGTPYQRGLFYTNGRAGTFILGTQFSIPATDSLCLEGHGSYMGARGRSGMVPSKNYGADLSFGLTYSWGKRLCAKKAYIPLANNSSFMVDTNQNF